jgi:hypothetical protein
MPSTTARRMSFFTGEHRSSARQRRAPAPPWTDIACTEVVAYRLQTRQYVRARAVPSAVPIVRAKRVGAEEAPQQTWRRNRRWAARRRRAERTGGSGAAGVRGDTTTGAGPPRVFGCGSLLRCQMHRDIRRFRHPSTNPHPNQPTAGGSGSTFSGPCRASAPVSIPSASEGTVLWSWRLMLVRARTRGPGGWTPSAGQEMSTNTVSLDEIPCRARWRC